MDADVDDAFRIRNRGRWFCLNEEFHGDFTAL